MNNEVVREDVKVGPIGYISLIFAILFFSGIFKDAPGGWSALDFTNLSGNFGMLGEIAEGSGKIAANFRGMGGYGAKDGFLFALSLAPSVIFALGVVNVVEHLGGLHAAQKLMTPLLRPLMGIPGIAGLTLIASLQSTDAGASMTKALREQNLITEKEKTIFCAFQFSAGGAITNYFSSGAALFSIMKGVPVIVPLVVMFVFKIFGANLMRFYLAKVREDE